MKKRGLSTVVTSLIMIILVLVAVSIVWVVVKNIISGGVDEGSLGKFTLNLKIKSAYVENGNVSVLIHRNAGEGELSGFQFILSNGTDAEMIKQNSILLELRDELHVLSPQKLTSIKKVSIAPITKTKSGEENVLDIIDEYILPYCGDGIVQNPYEECDLWAGNMQPPYTCDDSCKKILRIYVTSQSYNGNLKGISSDGLSGADAKCNSTDVNNPDITKTWKAVIQSTTPLRQIEGMLESNRHYKNSNNLLIGKTNSSGWFTTFPLNNPLSSIVANVWTGRKTGVDTCVGNACGVCYGTDCNCNNWIDASISYVGAYGDASKTNIQSFTYNGVPCSTTARLYCAEQL